jgi:DNA invertase Pin-like site-specific DNA recombinase
VTRLDRLARSTRDPLNTLAAITAKKAGFKSIGDAWADTTTSHGRLMLTVLAGLAEFERDLIPCAHRRRPGAGRGAWAENGPPLQAHPAPAEPRQFAGTTGAKRSATSPAATTSTRVRFRGLLRELRPKAMTDGQTNLDEYLDLPEDRELQNNGKMQ